MDLGEEGIKAIGAALERLGSLRELGLRFVESMSSTTCRARAEHRHGL